MKYDKTVEAVFVDRPNRFVANVKLGDLLISVHVKNTGRCRELLIPGVRVVLADSCNESRKYRYDLVSVWKESVGWINIDSQAPNAVVKEWLTDNNLRYSIFENLTYIKPEYKYGDSRIDFYMEQSDKKIFMEVKGCTLEIDGQGYFPDAPTERGVKHLNELSAACKMGYECYIAFVIAMNGIETVLPNRDMHPQFGTAFDEAVRNGVKVIFLNCTVTKDTLNISNAIIR